MEKAGLVDDKMYKFRSSVDVRTGRIYMISGPTNSKDVKFWNEHSWKIRIKVAKKYGKFTEDDRFASRNPAYCIIAERIFKDRYPWYKPEILLDKFNRVYFNTKTFVEFNNIDEVERLYKMTMRAKDIIKGSYKK